VVTRLSIPPLRSTTAFGWVDDIRRSMKCS
jgi:hypothetical protein